MWSVRWMEQALRLTRPGGWLMVFSDWRQVPLTSDALQIVDRTRAQGFEWSQSAPEVPVAPVVQSTSK